MNFLLDTNVISEGGKPRPEPGVIDRLAGMDESKLFLSVVSLADLRHGIERLKPGRRESALDAWLVEQLPLRFDDRLLPVDAGTVDHWSRIVARAQAAGRPIGAMDAFLVATAAQHQLTLVTRNVADFEATGVHLFNPWPQGDEA